MFRMSELHLLKHKQDCRLELRQDGRLQNISPVQLIFNRLTCNGRHISICWISARRPFTANNSIYKMQTLLPLKAPSNLCCSDRVATHSKEKTLSFRYFQPAWTKASGSKVSLSNTPYVIIINGKQNRTSIYPVSPANKRIFNLPRGQNTLICIKKKMAVAGRDISRATVLWKLNITENFDCNNSLWSYRFVCN